MIVFSTSPRERGLRTINRRLCFAEGHFRRGPLPQRAASQRAASQRDTSQRAASQRDTSQRAASQRDTSQRAASQRAASQRAASQRAASQRDTSQRDTSQSVGRDRGYAGLACWRFLDSVSAIPMTWQMRTSRSRRMVSATRGSSRMFMYW